MGDGWLCHGTAVATATRNGSSLQREALSLALLGIGAGFATRRTKLFRPGQRPEVKQRSDVKGGSLLHE